MHMHCLAATVHAFRRIGLSVQANGAGGDIRHAGVLHPVAYARADPGEIPYQASSRRRTRRRTCRRTRKGRRPPWRGKARGEGCRFQGEVKISYGDFLPFSGGIRGSLCSIHHLVWRGARTDHCKSTPVRNDHAGFRARLPCSVLLQWPRFFSGGQVGDHPDAHEGASRHTDRSRKPHCHASFGGYLADASRAG